MIVMTLLAVARALTVQVPAPTARLDVGPRAMGVGESAVLTWETTGATTIFISGLGVSPANGHSQVRPSATTEFLLIAEGPGGVTTDIAYLEVLGTKGDEDFPNESVFRHPLSFSVRAPSYTSLVTLLHTILQDSLRHTVMLTQGAGQVLRFVTNRRMASDLVGPEEPRIRNRRVAYLLELPRPGANARQFSFTIRSTIEYQRRIESTWRPETTDSLYDVQGRRLARLITTIH